MAVATEPPLVLVTGVSGFAATWIACEFCGPPGRLAAILPYDVTAAAPTDALLRCGYRIRGTVRSLVGKRAEHLGALAPGSRHRLELVEADLLDAASWSTAVRGATYVLHVASPFPIDDPDDESELIRPAVDGTLNILRAVGK